ncbi:hypothetical protein SLEP1_g53593 [Rubroshorea leprosula]|uniref:NB-ARC domain-containing protein n=1 Tax=Rubroshorea leprosula TaxID=152421 RepID=A0AAV5MBN5_9ROSI|nr:hypothetical protein SLEP1_g53593 [Rubroshorea leprosula]
MDAIGPVTDIVKDVVPTIKKYVKYQICHNDYVNEFKEMQTQLKHRRQDIEKGLHAQFMQPGKIAKEEVEAWLEKADQETAGKVVEDLICKGGCFTYICSSRKLDKRTQSLCEGIFKQGEKYTSAGESLVVDTPSIEYWATPGKLASKEVEDWLKKVGQQISIKVEDLINQGGCSSPSNLRKKIEELKQIFEQGEKYINAGESLVINDHSIEYCTTVFRERQEQLKLRQKDIKAKLENQLMQPGKIASMEVKDWFKKANQHIAIKVEDLISQGECSSSTNLKKNTEELKQILEEGKEFTNSVVSLVIDDHSIRGVPLLVDKCSGRDDIQRQILEWLKGDKDTRIAVCGMGGVGKTTIMKQVHNQLLKEPMFNKVIWVKVSKYFEIIVQHKKNFDILEFQKRIANSLALKLEKEDEKNETKLAGLISQKLGEGKFLLILDDVWEPFSLEDTGIPNLVGNYGCKVALTTRLQHVARVMDCEVIMVNPLPANAASALFLEKVGSDVFSDGKIKRDIEPFLKQILQKCDGVPLAIVTVAKSMRGKSLPRHWQLALSEFSKFESIIDCLKFSYKCLEPQSQQCFLYCALYPEDYGIWKEELIEYWIEEGLIYKEGKTREVMNWKGHDILDKLVDSCLLESVENSYEGDRVSMHDLLREMALEISQFFVKAGIALKKLPEEDEWRDHLKVSLMRNHIIEIPSSMLSPKCPMLTTLLLSYNNISTIPEAFFEHMLGLKILDLSWNRRLSGLPGSISKLKKLTTLLLKGCESIREVPLVFNLVDLKKLDLSWTSIEELSQGLNMLTNLKYLGLGGRLSETLDEVLQNLSKLQHLTVNTYKKFKWEKIGSWGKLQNLEKLDLQSLDNSNAVFGEIGAVAELAPLPASTFSYLQYISVHRCDKIKKLFSVRWLGYLQKLETIDVGSCMQLEEIIGSESEGEKVTLPKLESLTLIKLPQLKSIYCGSLICDSIKKIEIQQCNNIESVFGSGFNPLPNLESLWLLGLKNLKSLFDEEGLGLSPLVPPTSFFSLKEITIYLCHQLKKVFSSSWLLRYFQSLETIEVDMCWEMEEIISSSAHEEEKVTLPKLQDLKLTNLPQLKRIYSGSLICDSIKKIEIFNCENIESVFWSGFNPLPNLEYLELNCLPHLKSVFDEESLGLSPLVPPTSFFPLKGIRVFVCNQLKKVFSSGWLLRYFQSLETIEVQWCWQMEELISLSAHEEEKVTLPKLQSLKLRGLWGLKSICNHSDVLICDSIQRLEITYCKELKRIPLNCPLLDNAQSSYPPFLK